MLQIEALEEIVGVLKLPSTFLDSKGNEVTLALCAVSDFADHITDHLLSSGKDTHTHGVDIHDQLGYFKERNPATHSEIRYINREVLLSSLAEFMVSVYFARVVFLVLMMPYMLPSAHTLPLFFKNIVLKERCAEFCSFFCMFRCVLVLSFVFLQRRW